MLCNTGNDLNAKTNQSFVRTNIQQYGDGSRFKS